MVVNKSLFLWAVIQLLIFGSQSDSTSASSISVDSNPCDASAYYSAEDVAAQAYWDQFRTIRGPVNARKHSHPWLAALFNGAKQFCSGSLIDKTHILTSANCIAHMSKTDVTRLRIRLGAHTLAASEDTTQEFKVIKVVRHIDYDARKRYNDVAMLTLDGEVRFNQYVRPICLASGGNWVNETATVAGWGSLYEGGPHSSTLFDSKLRVWPLQECRQQYGNVAPGGIVSSYICAGDEGRDACTGDSGSPLVLKINNVWTQIGIMSWHTGCSNGEYPGVYSRLPTFLTWINRVKVLYQ